jgi:hypothetical protein
MMNPFWKQEAMIAIMLQVMSIQLSGFLASSGSYCSCSWMRAWMAVFFFLSTLTRLTKTTLDSSALEISSI